MTATRVQVSIGMPVYNGEKYLTAALDCLLSQTFTDFELVISDNASTDRTESICREYAARDPRVRYFRNELNTGGSANFNRVLELASSEYFKWACHDDLHAPGYFEQCVEVLDRDTSIVLCHSKTSYIDSNGVRLNLADHAGGSITDSVGQTHNLAPDDPARMLDSPQAYRRFSDMLTKPYACVNTFGLVRTDALRATGGFRPYFGSERLFLCELALRGRFHHIPEYLFSWRSHAEQVTQQRAMSRQKQMAPKAKKLVKAKFLPGYCRMLWKVPLSLNDRMQCHFVLFNHYARKLSARWGWARRRRPEAPKRAAEDYVYKRE